MKIPILGQTGEHEEEILYQKTQNLYPHVDQEGKGQISLLKTPGLTLFANAGSGPVRGSINYDGTYYAISRNVFYEINAGGAFVVRGTLNTSSGRCILAHNGANNGQQIIIVDGTNGYIYNSLYNTFIQIKQHASSTATAGTSGTNLEDTTAPFTADMVGTIICNTTDGTKTTITAFVNTQNVTVASAIFVSGETFEVGTDAFPDGATHVFFIDGYFLVNNPVITGQFNKSKSYDGTDWDALEFATAEQNSDELAAIISSNSERIYLIGGLSTEIWYNGNASPDFPFTPLRNGFMPYGTPSPYSVAEIDGVVFFIHQNKDGRSSVVMVNGIQPKVVSTPSIARMIDGYTLGNAYSWTYSYQQHSFYVITFPSDGMTLVYDISTNWWHEMSSKTLGYHRSSTHTFVYDKHLIGDPVSGNIYELDWDNYTDNGDAITRLRRSAHIHNGDRSIRHYSLWIDCKVGTGNSSVTDPKIMMRFRDKNGAWSKEKVKSLGVQGDKGNKVVFRQLGRSRDRVYELKITDAVDVSFIDSYANVGSDSRVIG